MLLVETLPVGVENLDLIFLPFIYSISIFISGKAYSYEFLGSEAGGVGSSPFKSILSSGR